LCHTQQHKATDSNTLQNAVTRGDTLQHTATRRKTTLTNTLSVDISWTSPTPF